MVLTSGEQRPEVLTGGVVCFIGSMASPDPKSLASSSCPFGTWPGGRVVGNTTVSRARSCRRYVNPALRAAGAEALDKARAEFKAGDRARGRTTLACAEQLHAAYARQAELPHAEPLRTAHAFQAEPMGELPSIGGSTPDEAEP